MGIFSFPQLMHLPMIIINSFSKKEPSSRLRIFCFLHEELSRAELGQSKASYLSNNDTGLRSLTAKRSKLMLLSSPLK